MIAKVSEDGGKIMILDYPWFVAYSGHDWAGENLASEIPGIPIFARHNGMINVLHTGGSVSSKLPNEIDPSNPAIRKNLWDE